MKSAKTGDGMSPRAREGAVLAPPASTEGRRRQPSPEDDGYALVWREEFDYEGLPDPAKWSYHVEANNWVHDRRHNEVQWYLASREENARVEGGRLKLTARREDWQGEPYTSARLRTKGKGDWQYGRVDVRAKLPVGKPGVWPAIWLMPTDQIYGSWPRSGEIDVMENVGFEPGRIHASVHTAAYNHRIKTHKSGYIDLETAHDDFHVYSLDWDSNRLCFFVDGDHYFTFEHSGNDANEWPFDQRFHLIINVAVGGNWGGAHGIDISAFPTTFEVDYIRVYQKLCIHDRASRLPKAPRYLEINPGPPSQQLAVALRESCYAAHLESSSLADNGGDGPLSGALAVPPRPPAPPPPPPPAPQPPYF